MPQAQQLPAHPDGAGPQPCLVPKCSDRSKKGRNRVVSRTDGFRRVIRCGAQTGHRAMDHIKTEAALAAPASGRMPGRCPAVGG
jgi:hypothetical protein